MYVILCTGGISACLPVASLVRGRGVVCFSSLVSQHTFQVPPLSHVCFSLLGGCLLMVVGRGCLFMVMGGMSACASGKGLSAYGHGVMSARGMVGGGRFGIHRSMSNQIHSSFLLSLSNRKTYKHPLTFLSYTN